MLHEVIDLQPGWRGTNRTVAEASRLVRESLVNPLVVTTAQDIVRFVPERDKMGEARAISDWVKRNIRYTNEGIETLKTPALLIEEVRRYGKAVGDCDDHVILWAALHKVVGNPVRFRVISQRPDRIANHIYGEVEINGRWITDDLIVKHQPLGWKIPNAEVTKSVVYGLRGLMEESMVVDVFSRPVGGAVQVTPESMMMVGRPRYLPVQQKAARRYRSRPRGGAYTVGISGEVENIGFIPALIAAASSVAPLVKKAVAKIKKKKDKPAPAPAPVAPSPEELEAQEARRRGGRAGGLEQYIPVILLMIGGLALISAVRR